MKINLQNSKQFQAAKTYTLKHNNKDLNRSLELAEKYKTDVAVGVFVKKYWIDRKKAAKWLWTLTEKNTMSTLKTI